MTDGYLGYTLQGLENEGGNGCHSYTIARVISLTTGECLRESDLILTNKLTKFRDFIVEKSAAESKFRPDALFTDRMKQMMRKTIRVVILLGGIVLIQACVQLRNEMPVRYCVASEAFRIAMGLPSDEALSVAGMTAVHGMAEGDPFYPGTNAVWAVPDRVAIEKLAQEGDPWAQFSTGWFHDYGTCGAERDFFKAVDFYRAAARQGYIDAYGNLAWLYLSGEGVPQNTDLAKATFEKGVAAGSPIALSGLGYMYLYGVGVKTDYALARKLFEQGVAKGYAHSEYHIGLFHDCGYGCSVNRQEAKKWFFPQLARVIARLSMR